MDFWNFKKGNWQRKTISKFTGHPQLESFQTTGGKKKILNWTKYERILRWQKTGYEEVYYFSELIFALTHAVESSNEWLLAFSSPSFISNFQTWIFFDDVEWGRFVRLNMTNFASNHVRRNRTCAKVMDFSRKNENQPFSYETTNYARANIFQFSTKKTRRKM